MNRTKQIFAGSVTSLIMQRNKEIKSALHVTTTALHSLFIENTTESVNKRCKSRCIHSTASSR